MMRRLMCVVFTLLLMTYLMSGCSGNSSQSKDAEQKEQFVVGMEVDYAPFNYELVSPTATSVAIDGGYADGYDVMIAQRIADALGRELVVRKIEWDGLGVALEAGDIDAIIAGMTATESREEGIDFTTPYYGSEGMVMIVRKDCETAAFTDIQQFAQYRIIGQMGTTYDDVIDQIENVIHITPKATYPEMVVALQHDEVDGITAEAPVGLSVIASNPDLIIVYFAEGHGFDVDTTVSIGLREGTRGTDFFNAVQATLDDISLEERESMMLLSIENQPSEE